MCFICGCLGYCVCSLEREDDLSKNPKNKNTGAKALVLQPLPLPKLCLVFLSNGQECAARKGGGGVARAASQSAPSPGSPSHGPGLAFHLIALPAALIKQQNVSIC